jgi:hypothetical protein
MKVALPHVVPQSTTQGDHCTAGDPSNASARPRGEYGSISHTKNVGRISLGYEAVSVQHQSSIGVRILSRETSEDAVQLICMVDRRI